MPTPTPVIHQGQTYALLCLRSQAGALADQPAAPGFITADADEFQVGMVERPAGLTVPAHLHPRSPKTIEGVSELLYVEHGHLRLTVFADDWTPLTTVELRDGDFALLMRGGHEVTMLAPTRTLEVKQGPYPGPTAAKVMRDAQ